MVILVKVCVVCGELVAEREMVLKPEDVLTPAVFCYRGVNAKNRSTSSQSVNGGLLHRGPGGLLSSVCAFRVE